MLHLGVVTELLFFLSSCLVLSQFFDQLYCLMRQVFTDTVPSDLADLWNAKSAQQKLVIRLCAAVRAADGDQLQVIRRCYCLQCAISLYSHSLLGCALWLPLVPGICMPMLSDAQGARQFEDDVMSRVSSEKSCCGVVALIRQSVLA